jgi:hypothetical protein
MIIKITNHEKGRNCHTFTPLLFLSEYFRSIGVNFVTDGKCDIEFLGMADFLDKSVTLEESIDYGIKSLENKDHPVFLFDGSDSTSLMGAVEVLKNTSALRLYKNQILDRESYKLPSAFNKWFFGTGSDLDLGYDISLEDYKDIRLTGWNIGYHNMQCLDFVDSNLEKNVDVCAIYHAQHPENYDHKVRNDILYNQHRKTAWSILEKRKDLNFVKDSRPANEYKEILQRSKMIISPFGMGEVCHRDFEAIQFGSILIKPDMDKVKTAPNIYKAMETYIPVKLDWSDLNEKIQFVLDNYNECREISKNARRVFEKEYSAQNILLHWRDEISSFLREA